MDLTRVTGSELAANLIIFAILLHMKQGEELMSPFLERRPGLSVKKMRETLKLLLSYEHWYMSKRVPRIDVITAQPAVNELMIQLQKNFPREAKKKKSLYNQITQI